MTTGRQIQHIERRERERAALKLRKAGLTYARIGQQMNISEATACRTVNRCLNRLITKVNEGAEELRRLELERLDEMLFGCYLAATKGHLGSVDRVLKIMERRAKLLGLDAPQKFEGDFTNTSPDIDAQLRELAEQIKSGSQVSAPLADSSQVESDNASG